jgi:hypothetical protein
VYDCRLLRLERRTAPSFPTQSIVDDSFKAFTVALRRGPGDPCRKVVDKCYGSSMAVDVSLYQIGIEKEKEDRR